MFKSFRQNEDLIFSSQNLRKKFGMIHGKPPLNHAQDTSQYRKKTSKVTSLFHEAEYGARLEVYHESHCVNVLQ